MIYDNNSTALILDHNYVKDSLIYFDKIVPLFHHARTRYGSENEIQDEENERILNEALPDDLKKGGNNNGLYDEFIHNDLFLLLFFRKMYKFGEQYVNDPYSHPDTERFLNVRNSLFYNLDKSSTAVKNGIFISFTSNDEFKESENTRLSLMKLNLIDSRTIPFDKILELRKDKNSIEKLRSLRLFFYQNYNGKSKAYIEDDLLKRLNDYEETAKYWDLKTGLSSINCFLSSKILMSSIAAALTSAFLGNMTISAITASSGVTIELGKLIINLKNESLEKNEKLRQDPVSFLYELDKLR